MELLILLFMELLNLLFMELLNLFMELLNLFMELLDLLFVELLILLFMELLNSLLMELLMCRIRYSQIQWCKKRKICYYKYSSTGSFSFNTATTLKEKLELF